MVLLSVFLVPVARADTQTSLGDRGGEGTTPFTGLAQAPEANLFTGALTTRIPIEIPPGRKDMTPRLAFQYSSARGPSPFGYGWELPLGRIERSTKWGPPSCSNGHQDEFVAVLPNGGAVELVNDPPGSAFYRPAVEQAFLEAEVDTAANRWTLRDRAGLRYTFGDQFTARVVTSIVAPIMAENPDGTCDFTAVWMLTRVEDPSGGSIEIEWSQFGNIPVPTQIRYGGNDAGVAHIYRVDFSYGLRPTGDRHTTYRHGIEQSLHVRLAGVGVSTEIPTYTQIRQYYFHYFDTAEARSLLSTVESTAQPTQTFVYSSPLGGHDDEAAATPIDVPVEHAYLRKWSNSGEVDHSIIDMNGDGILDLVDGEWFPWTVRFGYADGADDFGFAATATSWSGQNSSNLGRIRNVWINSGDCDDNGWACTAVDTFDITGDGLIDYVQATVDNGPWSVYRGGVQPDGSWGFDPDPLVWPAPDRTMRRIKNGKTYRDVIDVNGDGLPDYVNVDHHSGVWTVHRNNGLGFDPEAMPFFAAPVDSIAEDVGDDTVHMMADFNGDGLSDLLRHVDGQAEPLCDGFNWDPGLGEYIGVHDCLLVYFNTGQGFTSDPRVFALPRSARGLSTRESGEEVSALFDLNGDGLPDWVERGPNDEWLVLLNLGGELEPVSVDPSPPHDAIATRIWPGGGGAIRKRTGNRTEIDLLDLNGDGFLDRVSGGDSTWLVQLSRRAERPHLLTMMENGLGGTNTIVYEPSTRFEHLGGDLIGDMPFVNWLVTGTRLNDGLCTPPPGANVFDRIENPCIDAGHELISFLAYEDGRLAVEYDEDALGTPIAVRDREFRGFRMVTRTDIDGNDSVTVFGQDATSVGQPLVVLRYAGAAAGGGLVRGEVNAWATRTVGAQRAQLWLLQNTRVTFDLGTDSHLLVTRNEDVDAYGNVLHSWTEGTAAPRVETFIEYAVPDEGGAFRPYDKPQRTHTRDIGGLLEDARFYYDDLPLGTVASGHLTRLESWLDTTSSWLATDNTYDVHGNIVETRAANGATTTTSYDDGSGAFLYPIAVTNPLGHQQITLIDYRFGEPAFSWGANGVATAIGYAYDGAGRLICEVHPGDSFQDCTIASTYNFAGQAGELSWVRIERKQSLYATPRTSTSFFDALGRSRHTETLQVVNGATEVVRRDEVRFDAGGRVVEKFYPYRVGAGAPDNGSTRFDYHLNGSSYLDPLGRVHRTIHSDGGETRTEFAGPSSTTYDEAGEKVVRQVDALGRVVREEIYDGSIPYSSSSSVFDGMGRLIELYQNDASMPLKTVSYDTMGRKVALVDRDSGTWSYGYDAAGNLVYQDDPKASQHVQYCYDLINRPLRRCGLPQDFVTLYSCEQLCASDESHYTYDDEAVAFAIGRLTRVSDGAGELRILEYDPRGNQLVVEREIDVQGTVTTAHFEYTYNDTNEVVSITYPDGEVVTTTYDEAGQPVELFNTDGRVYVEGVRYDEIGRATEVIHGNGARDTRVYSGPENRHRLSTISTLADGDLALTLVYDYDARGQIVGIGDIDVGPTTNNATFAYDHLGRLVGFDSLVAADRTYAYDSWGNMTRKGSMVLDYGDPFDPAVRPHQVIGVGAVFITHDANGNRAVGASGESYSYDAEDRLRSVGNVGISGADIRFYYGHDGQQRAKVVDDGGVPRVTRHFSDLVLTTADGATVKSYFLGGLRIASQRSDDSSWQMAGLYHPPIRLAATWIGRPAVILELAPAAQLVAGAAVMIFALSLALWPRRRRRAVIGLRLQRGPTIGMAFVFLIGTFPWPLAVRPVAAGCGDPTPTPPSAESVDHFHTDHLRSTLLVTAADGTVVEQIRYYPYGEVRGRWDGQGVPIADPAPDDVRFEYTGYESELYSGLRYAGARFYDPILGSFLTPDPAAEFASPYAYSGWNPVNVSDPSGECSFCALLVGFLIGFVVAAVEAAVAGASFVDVLKAGVISGAIAGASSGLAGPVGVASGKLGGWGVGMSVAFRIASQGWRLYTTVQSFRSGEYVAGARGVLGVVVAAFGGLRDSHVGVGAKPAEIPGSFLPEGEVSEVARTSYRQGSILSPFPAAPGSGTRATVDTTSVTILGVRVEVGTAWAVDSAGGRRVFDVFSVGFETEVFELATTRGRQVTDATSVEKLGGSATTIGGSGNPSLASLGGEITATQRYMGYTVYFGAAYGTLPVGAYGVREYWTPRVE
jgi:RHS repeat-associated protein